MYICVFCISKNKEKILTKFLC